MFGNLDMTLIQGLAIGAIFGRGYGVKGATRVTLFLGIVAVSLDFQWRA